MKNYSVFVRNIPDFPKKGILFRDITPMLLEPRVFASVVNEFVRRLKGKKIDKIVAIESRGFIFGGAIANKLGVGLAIVRKPGKLPYNTIKETYDLEYGKDSLEIHKDAIRKGEKVVIFDDVLATGGTAKATGRLVKRLGGKVLEYDFLIELLPLKGIKNLKGEKIFSLIKF
ncbi:MAG: adenine phosphoribosyltransferase [Deltaproteobacteria bacterium]|nr:adenine phosphoribosyltransferase [Deltaproteobacteria bacterium]